MTEFMGLAEKVSKFNQEAKKHIERQTLNPFSGTFSRSPSPRPKFNKDEYGKPAAGSKTELRGQRAYTQISREILELCNVIHDMGRRRRDPDGDEVIIIPFGELFAFYTKISDKVVGLLIAAKKRGFVWFEPEILFQRRDDDVLVALIKPIGEIRNIINRQISGSPSPAPAANPSEPEKTSTTPAPSPLARQESNPSSEASSNVPEKSSPEVNPTPSTPAAESKQEPASQEETVAPEKANVPTVESTPSEEQTSPTTTTSEPTEGQTGQTVAVSEDQNSLTLKIVVEVDPSSVEGASSSSAKSGTAVPPSEEERTPPSNDTGEKTLA